MYTLILKHTHTHTHTHTRIHTHTHTHTHNQIQLSKGAFTPDVNEAFARMIYMLSQCKDAIDNPAALFARITRCELSVWRDIRESRQLKNLKFGGYSRHVNQSGACSSSDVITSGGRKSETTMEDKLIVVVCGYPELYDTTSYFYKNMNKFSNETGASWQKPLPWRESTSVV